MSNVERIYGLDGQIRAGNYPNAARLMEKFEVKLRAARADAAFLRDRLKQDNALSAALTWFGCTGSSGPVRVVTGVSCRRRRTTRSATTT